MKRITTRTGNTYILRPPKGKHRKLINSIMRKVGAISTSPEKQKLLLRLSTEASMHGMELDEYLLSDVISEDDKIEATKGSNFEQISEMTNAAYPLLVSTLFKLEIEDGDEIHTFIVNKKTSFPEIEAELDEVEYADIMELIEPAMKMVFESMMSDRKKKE